MAEPSWVLRARRTRSHRYYARRALARRSGPPPYFIRVATWVWRFLPRWLTVRVISPLLWLLFPARTQRAADAVWAARNVLDGLLADADVYPFDQMIGLRAQIPRPADRAGIHISELWHVERLPLRYAAHVVALVVVLSIVLLAKPSAGAGVLQLDLPVSRMAADVPAVDREALPALPATDLSQDDDSLQPVLRNVQPGFESVFVTSHTVAEGDTLGDLAKRYRVSPATLFWSNDLEQSAMLVSGEELRIPRISGVTYVIAEGDTLASIGASLHVDPQVIVLLKSNGVLLDRPLPVGREIFVPSGIKEYPADILARYGDAEGIAAMQAVTAGVVQEEQTNLRSGPSQEYPRVGYLDAGNHLQLLAHHENWVKVSTLESATGWVRSDMIGLSDTALASLPDTNDFPPPPPRWIWPARGRLTSPFGWRSIPFRSFHDGLDIANAAGTHIYAARTGRVIEAGWCSGFGYCVKLDHGEGLVTIYGHMLRRPPVSVGTTVNVGDLIGYMGSSYDRSGGGYSTGVHLHFTVKLNGKAVNPIQFLP